MTSIADIEDLPAHGSCGVQHEGRELLLVRRGEEVLAYENRCPHTGETLDPLGRSVLSEDGLLLQCQRHAAQFVVATGECVGGPCLGERLQPVAVIVSQGALYPD